jgi:hypothetical protein
MTVTGLRNVLWCVLAFGIVACAATLPDERLALAERAIERAEAASAADYAAVELTTARDKLLAAQHAAGRRDGAAAARLADEAGIDAELAESTARAKRQQQRAGEIDESLRDLRDAALRRDDAGVSGTASAAPVAPPTI